MTTFDDNVPIDKPRIKYSLKQLLSLCWPNASISLIQLAIGLISVIFVGHLGSDQSSGASLGNFYNNVFSNSIPM